MPVYSPNQEASHQNTRPYSRMSNADIEKRMNNIGDGSREKPWVYMDAIDTVLNVRPDIKLVVADARSTESIREELKKHSDAGGGKYTLAFYPEKMSQWILLNDVWKRFGSSNTEYFVYTSSDILWGPDWIAEAVREFEKDPTLQIIFPCVQSGDPNLPSQIAPGARDMDMFEPPYQHAARAPVMNAYAMIFRIDFLKTYDGYPTIFRNCFTESFLFYLCEAMGGKIRLMPRGWCYHANGIDAWRDETGYYGYDSEKEAFERIMTEVQEARMEGKMTPEFLKKVLYKHD